MPAEVVNALKEQGEWYGDVPAGATTDYVEMPGGVYGYAAYDFELDGAMTQQAVIDWVGEKPLSGSDFTYTLLFNPEAFSENRAIELEAVATDH